MGNEGISPEFRQKLEHTAERFIRRFDRNDSGTIDGKERQSKRTWPEDSQPATVGIVGDQIFFNQRATARADVLDGQLFKTADTSGDGALSAGELVTDFLKRNDTNTDGTTTPDELKAANQDSRRALRQHLRAQTREQIVNDDTSFFGRISH